MSHQLRTMQRTNNSEASPLVLLLPSPLIAEVAAQVIGRGSTGPVATSLSLVSDTWSCWLATTVPCR